jgi:hypothetical protein
MLPIAGRGRCRLQVSSPEATALPASASVGSPADFQLFRLDFRKRYLPFIRLFSDADPVI